MASRSSSIRSRRAFLGMAAGGAMSTAVAAHAAVQLPTIETVTSAVAPDTLGVVLAHEHVFSRFGADPSDTPVYDEAEVLATVVPYLAYLRALGVRTIADATARRFGRHPALLRSISKASGVRILTNTGLYGAAEDRYVPGEVRSLPADAIAATWIDEARTGIGDTGIRPGFIKVGVDAGPLSPIDATLVEAGALTHRATGLLLAVHTGDNAAAAHAQLRLLADRGVQPSAWMWVHASTCRDDDALWEVAQRGGRLGFDSLRAETFDRHMALVLEARRRGLLGRVLLSHDGNSWPAPGRLPRDYDLLLTTGVRQLRTSGLDASEVQRLLVANPREAFTPAVRTRR